jgi:hypothetical protein
MKEIINECKKRIKALHDFLHGRNLALVYDWNMETLLIGPRGLKWIGCEQRVPAHFHTVSGDDTWKWYTGQRILPAGSVFYYNDGSDNTYTLDPKHCIKRKPLLAKCKDTALAKARELARDLLQFVMDNGCSLYYDYGDSRIGVVKGAIRRNASRSDEAEEFCSSSDEVVSRTILAVYSGDDPDGELVAPDPKP